MGSDVACPTGTGSIINLRKSNWCSVVYGATGFLYYNRFVSGFAAGYNLITPGAIQTGYMTSFYAIIPWHKLVPDYGHTFVLSGYGTEFTNITSAFTTTANNTSDNGTDSFIFVDNFVTASLASDGTLGLVYFQSHATITIAMSLLAGPVTAQWYDPTNNAFSSSGSYSGGVGASNQTFTPTGNNSAGDPDWVLILYT